MNVKFQTLILIILILFSVMLTKSPENRQISGKIQNPISGEQKIIPSPYLNYQAATLRVPSLPPETTIEKSPQRKWEVLDPSTSAAAVLIESLDDGFPFFYYQTYKAWPLASLTKLLTAVVVLEDIGINKKIEITDAIVATEGDGGGFQAGEIYTALDILKIMIITSSNDAAAAFENYYGKEALINRLNEKAKELKMFQTKVYDATGLSDKNVSTAADLKRLIKYIIEKHPDILNWSRLPSILVQPLNKGESRNLKNINPLVDNKDFLGGKTGTSSLAKENLVTIFSFNNQRLIVVILGAPDRYKEFEKLLNWVGQAYNFNL